MCITASGTFNGRELKDIPVLNPGDWIGKCWLLEIGGSYFPVFTVVEAENQSEAVNVLADDEKYGSNIIVDDTDLSDYPEDERHHSGSGKVLDLDHLMIHGQEGSGWPCRYHGDDLPEDGMKPTDYWRRDDDLRSLKEPPMKIRTQADVLQSLPHLVAHLIAESLGYFTPQSAANAIAHYTKGEAFFCEWYYDWASKRCRSTNADLRDTVREVGELAIQRAVQRRSHHRGPMAEFKRALALVRQVRQGGEGPVFASWF